ncbi:MAG: hypothetical protein RLZZ618_2003 [Pseudomonadota bacterium]
MSTVLARRPGVAWCVMALGLVLVAFATRSVDHLAIDWQPSLAWHEPWRWWTNVFVHYSQPHFWGNVLATMLVAAFGWAARMPLRATIAWFVSWPLMHLALLSQPELRHYGGLSGLMHAGVAVATLHLVLAGPRRDRIIGGIVGVMLIVKVLTETPWRGAIQHTADWDIPVAPVAHAFGLMVGLVCCAGAHLLTKRQLVRSA